MAKIERKFMAHFLNAAEPSAAATDYVRIGADLEEYNVELSAQVDKKKNILGETSVLISSYEAQGGVEPYYADKDDPLFPRLQKIVDDRLVLDDTKTTAVEVHLWTAESGTSFEAYEEEVFIEVTSYGGDTTGYQIPFNVHYTGKRTKGTFDTATKAFTPVTDAPEA